MKLPETRNEMVEYVLGPKAQLVYPGHPLVIAVFIMKAFPDLQTALEDGKALRSQLVPGAGGNVHEAIDLLKSMDCSLRTREGVIAAARDYWAQSDDMQNRDPERRLAGQAQAEQIEPEFLQLALTWIGKRLLLETCILEFKTDRGLIQVYQGDGYKVVAEDASILRDFFRILRLPMSTEIKSMQNPAFSLSNPKGPRVFPCIELTRTTFLKLVETWLTKV